MTTLAYDGHLIAIDSQVTVGDAKLSEDKSYRLTLPDGRKVVAFGAGTVSAIQQCVRLLREGSLAFPEGDYTLLVWGLEELPVAFEGSGDSLDTRGSWYVAGSGSQAALAALHCGLDAPGAVEIACRVDVHTGGPVRIFDTRTGRFRRRRT